MQAAEPNTAAGAIHIHIFLSKTCPHCEAVEKKSLQRLAQKQRCEIIPHYYDVDDLEQYKRLVVLERRMNDTGNDLPVVFIGTHVLGGTKEIEEKLTPLVRQLKDVGAPAIKIPTLEEAREAFAAPSPSPGERSAKIRLAYFEEPGCRQCARVDRILKLAVARYPNLEVRRFPRRTRADQVLLEALCERAGVSGSRRLLTPAVFVGQQALILEEINDASLDRLCATYAGTGSPAVWDISDDERSAAMRRLWERSRNISLAAVTIGGLIDGVNPCAFATIVFLVCCLAGAGRDRGMILTAGAGFTAGVFLAYFATGIGLSEALLRLDILPRVSRVVTWCIIGATSALGVVSFWDFLLALRGKPREMTLKLPHKLRMRINSLIARKLRARSILLTAVGLGIAISLLEFVCTGQIYLPLIRYMTAVADSRARGVALLLLYNIAFILPLIVVFVAVYFGLSSERLLAVFKRHLPASKLFLCAFFIGLAGLMIHLQLKGAI